MKSKRYCNLVAELLLTTAGCAHASYPEIHAPNPPSRRNSVVSTASTGQDTVRANARRPSLASVGAWSLQPSSSGRRGSSVSSLSIPTALSRLSITDDASSDEDLETGRQPQSFGKNGEQRERMRERRPSILKQQLYSDLVSSYSGADSTRDPQSPLPGTEDGFSSRRNSVVSHNRDDMSSRAGVAQRKRRGSAVSAMSDSFGTFFGADLPSDVPAANERPSSSPGLLGRSRSRRVLMPADASDADPLSPTGRPWGQLWGPIENTLVLRPADSLPPRGPHHRLDQADLLSKARRE